MKKIIHAVCLFIGILSINFFSYSSVYAETFITSDIVSDTLWNESGSPYIIEKEINVSAGTVLKIEPGVEVKLSGGLNVFGTLSAEGSEGKNILFNSTGNDQNKWFLYFDHSTSTFKNVSFKNSFNGLIFNDSAVRMDSVVSQNLNSFIESNNSKVELRDGEIYEDGGRIKIYNKSEAKISNLSVHDIVSGTPIAVYNKSDLNLSNSNFLNIHGYTALAVYNQTRANISSSTFDNVSGQNAVAFYGGSNVNFIHSKIVNTRGLENAMVIFGNDYFGTTTVTLANDVFDQGEADGLYVYGKADVLISTSTFSNFKTAVFLTAGPRLSLTDSIISENDVGLGVYGNANLHVQSNSITRNTTYAADNNLSKEIDLSRNWWGSASGPGDQYYGPINFSPWLENDPFLKEVSCCSSVAFIPGLEGSRLYSQEVLGENQLWEPNWYRDVQKLYLDENGQSVRNDIYTKDIIDESKIGGFNIYKKFGESLNNLVSSKTIKEWKALPYDWRENIDDLIVGGSVLKTEQKNFEVLNFVKEIENLAASSTTGKVTIIAHSNGGLITKLLIQELQKKGEENLVDKVILVAVPALGTPKTIAALLHGYDQSFAGGTILDSSTARNLGINMPSAYNLLPSYEYFNKVSDPVVIFDQSLLSSSSPYTVPTQNPTSINNFQDLKNFLLAKSDGRKMSDNGKTNEPYILNQALLSKSDEMHMSLDNWEYPENIKVFQIVGWGLDTLRAIKYKLGQNCAATGIECFPILDEVPVFTQDGDNTVVTSSASALVGNNLITYYVDLPEHNRQFSGLRRNRGHADILEVAEVDEMIRNIVSDKGELPGLITVEKPQGPKSIYISVHSPVSIDAYDSEGNHTGLIKNPNPNSDIQLMEENIPNSFYLNFGEGKYIGLPQVSSSEIKMSGTGYGTFTVEIEKEVGDEATTTIFADLPVTPRTSARLENYSGDTPQIFLDINGDAQNDFVLNPNDSFDSVLYLSSMKLMISDKKLSKSIDKLIEMINEGKIEKAESKIKKFVFRTPENNSGKIKRSDDLLFVEMLGKLVDNVK